jgi:hypothetical protein
VGNHLGDFAVSVERILVVVGIEEDAKRAQRFLDVRENLFLGLLFESSFRRFVPERVTGGLQKMPGNVPDVLALIVVIRKIDTLPEKLQVAETHGIPEDPHLPPGIVEVVLPLHLVPGPLIEASDRVSKDRAPPVPNGERARGVGAHKFDLDALPRAGERTAVELPGFQDRRDLGTVELLRQPNVDEAGAGDLHGADERGINLPRPHDFFGELPRPFPHGLGQGQGHVRGQIPVLLLAGMVKRDGNLCGRVQRAKHLAQGVSKVLSHRDDFLRSLRCFLGEVFPGVARERLAFLLGAVRAPAGEGWSTIRSIRASPHSLSRL